MMPRMVKRNPINSHQKHQNPTSPPTPWSMAGHITLLPEIRTPKTQARTKKLSPKNSIVQKTQSLLRVASLVPEIITGNLGIEPRYRNTRKPEFLAEKYLDL
jgi:hypothetical protein